MSTAYNRRKKELRALRDGQNPERIRIRRLIRAGALPRWYIQEFNHSKLYRTGRYTAEVKSTKGFMPTTTKIAFYVTWPIIRSTFKKLTTEEVAK